MTLTNAQRKVLEKMHRSSRDWERLFYLRGIVRNNLLKKGLIRKSFMFGWYTITDKGRKAIEEEG